MASARSRGEMRRLLIATVLGLAFSAAWLAAAIDRGGDGCERVPRIGCNRPVMQ